MFKYVPLYILLLSSTCFAQLELTYTKVKSLSGITKAIIDEDEILIGDDSRIPTIVNGAIIQTKTTYTFIELEVTKDGQDIEAKQLKDLRTTSDDGTVELKSRWIVKGEGIYRVTARAADLKLGFKRAKLDILVGPTPKPTPIDPVPPTPEDTTLSPYSRQIKDLAVSYIQDMGNDYAKLATGKYTTVMEASNAANALDLITRNKLKVNLGKLMEPKLGNSTLPTNYPSIFQEISNGFRGVK